MVLHRYSLPTVTVLLLVEVLDNDWNGSLRLYTMGLPDLISYEHMILSHDMGRPFFPRAIPIYGVLPYSMIIVMSLITTMLLKNSSVSFASWSN